MFLLRAEQRQGGDKPWKDSQRGGQKGHGKIQTVEKCHQNTSSSYATPTEAMLARMHALPVVDHQMAVMRHVEEAKNLHL